MNRLILVCAILVSCVAASASDPQNRPRIFGIAYVRILVTNVDKASNLYSLALHAVPPPFGPKTPCDWCERAPISVAMSGKRLGPIVLEVLQAPVPANLLREIAFSTDDAKKLRDLLLKSHIAAEKLTKCGDDPCFGTVDPENHRIIFVQKISNPAIGITGAYPSFPITSPIIHAGFIVRDRAATEHFYKDILGFRPYWHGGMKDKEDDWVSMQVPDGTDWLEFMVNVSPDTDQRLRGIMNHIAIGVPDIHETEKLLRAAGAPVNEEPEIGRDGKWQLNVYDPDLTRVEFMEFKPVQKPCCSEFTAAHPGPKP
jgi:catechol 2,3-dioxygenase-like lactoylglutathione lyase family enzyme